MMKKRKFDLELYVSNFSYHGWMKSPCGDIYCYGPLLHPFFAELKSGTNANGIVEEISTGNLHTIIRMASSVLYSCGSDYSGQTALGKLASNMHRDDKAAHTLEPTKIRESDFDSDVVGVVCGCVNSFFITKSNRVYGAGDNDRGQLGIGDKALNLARPKPLLFDKSFKPKQISSGLQHTLLLSTQGEVFGCGFTGKFGGGAETNNILIPTRIPTFLDKSVKAIHAGQYHSLFLVEDTQRVWVAGDSLCSNGQLGLGMGVNKCELPKMLPLRNVVNITGGHNHSFFETVDGFYLCGRGTDGRLANGTLKNEYVPKKMDLKEIGNRKVVKYCCAANHTVFFTPKFVVYGCGENEWGALFNGVAKNENLMMELNRTFTRKMWSERLNLVEQRKRLNFIVQLRSIFRVLYLLS